MRFAALLYSFVMAALLLAVAGAALVAQWQPLAVVSGSMQPAISPGSIVLVEAAARGHFYDPPSVVVRPDPVRHDRLVTHRVVAKVRDDSGTVSYRTKGDANRVVDSGLVPHDAVIGSVRLVVPLVGLPALWLHNGSDLALAVWTLGSLLAVAVLLLRPSG